MACKNSCFAASDEFAVGAIRALKDEGIRVPEDVSVIGFDNIESTSQIPPAKPRACFVNRSKRFVLEPPKGGYLCYSSLNFSS
jgi:hypothetical protein